MSLPGCDFGILGIQGQMAENKAAISRIGSGGSKRTTSLRMFTNRDLLWREEKPGGQLPVSLSFMYCVYGSVWMSQFSAG